jgi:2-oxoglutarate ferredoxin oxidoreductase subunit delta
MKKEEIKIENKQRGSKMEVMIAEDLCKGCSICVDFCPRKALQQSKKLTRRGFYPPERVKEKECSGCRLCELTCPDLAIWVVENGKK